MQLSLFGTSASYSAHGLCIGPYRLKFNIWSVWACSTQYAFYEYVVILTPRVRVVYIDQWMRYWHLTVDFFVIGIVRSIHLWPCVYSAFESTLNSSIVSYRIVLQDSRPLAFSEIVTLLNWKVQTIDKVINMMCIAYRPTLHSHLQYAYF